jgi:hypothetical protein
VYIIGITARRNGTYHTAVAVAVVTKVVGTSLSLLSMAPPSVTRPMVKGARLLQVKVAAQTAEVVIITVR